MKKGYVISWFFPPTNSSEGLLTFKLLKNSEFDYVVFTQKDDASWTYETVEDRLVSDNIKVVFAKDTNIDEWVNEGIAYFEQHADEFDFIMSRSMSPESILVAREIKKKHPDIPWIASFGDPLANNPYLMLYPRKSPFSVKGLGTENVGFKKKMNPFRVLKNCLWHIREAYRNSKDTYDKQLARIEKMAMYEADRIIVNSQNQANYMASNYPENIKDKFVVVPHSFDKEFYSTLPKEKNEKIKIVYLGSLTSIRTPLPFIQAVDRLCKTVPDLESKLEVELYGTLSDDMSYFLKRLRLTRIIKQKNSVGYFESLNIMRNADWCLMIDANLGSIMGENIFFPGKLADYLGSGSGIFTITMDKGPSSDITRAVGGLVMTHSVDEIYMNLYRVVAKGLKPNTQNVENFDVINVAKNYDQEVKKIVKTK